jgi:hypothetical protein
VAKLYDKMWLWYLALLCDISHRLNDLNTRFQGQEKLISDMSGALRAFEKKLKLFLKQMENAYFFHFSCDLFHKVGSICFPFPSVVLQK